MPSLGGSGRGVPRQAPLPPTNENNGPHTTTITTTPEEVTQVEQRLRNDALPDILHSHLPPPYSTLPPNDRVTQGPGGMSGRRLPPPAHPPPPPPHLVPPLCHGGPPSPPPPLVQGRTRSGRTRGGFHPFHGGERLRGAGSIRANPHHHHHHPRTPHHPVPHHVGGGVNSEVGEEPKHCCGVMVTQTVSIRWFIVMIAFVGLCCAIVGTVLGALKATGREHLTVSLLMIGVGIVLITVSGIAWRLTSHDAPSCRAMLGLQPTSAGAGAGQDLGRRFLPRVPPYGRPPHPYAAMLYPEFQYRPPPPSYQASMQEYRLRLLLLDRQQGAGTSNTGVGGPSNSLSPVSPPPTYRSHASSTLHSRPPLSLVDRDYSRPPSYRSRASSVAVLRSTNGAPHASSDTLDSRHTMRTDTLSREHRSITPGTPGSLCTPGTPPPSQLLRSHSRDPSLTLSYLSHESLMFNDSAHSMLPLNSNTLDRSTLDRSTLERPPLLTSPSGESRTSVTAGLSDDSPVAVVMPPNVLNPNTCWTSVPTPAHYHHHHHRHLGDSGTSDHSPELVIRAVTGKHPPDINTVTIVQTTDSSQVRNQDTVIVAVTGSQQVIPNHHRRVSENNFQQGASVKGEVQILAQV